MNPKVSIIVPAYNTEAYIGECIDRLLALRYADFEIIAVDDGSTDRTGSLLDSYGAPVRVIHQSNGGVSRARNAGIEAATGEFIMFCDADDYYHPDALNVLSAAMTDDVDIVAGQMTTRPPRGRLSLPSKVRIVSGLTMARNVLYQKRGFDHSPCGKLFRRSLFGGEVMFKPDTKYEDLELSLRLFADARQVAVLSSKVYFYRQHSGSFMHQWSRGRLDALAVAESLVNQAAAYGSDLEAAAISRRYSAAWNLLRPANDHGETEVADRCRQIIRATRLRALMDPNTRLKNKLAFLPALLI